MVRLLAVENRADVNQAADYGAIPLFSAAQSGHASTVRLLANCKADVNTPMCDGATPLIIAIQNRSQAVAHVLLEEFKADPNPTTGRDGLTAAYMAAQLGQTSILQLLVKHKGDVNVSMKNGMTPVMAAVRMGHKEAGIFLFQQHMNKVNFPYD
jgi:ankyrin repeat protein